MENKSRDNLFWAHIHDFNLPYLGDGALIKRCHENLDGELWVSDDKKSTQVNFCPSCGYEAKKKVYNDKQ